jgi:hypothetical protein
LQRAKDAVPPLQGTRLGARIWHLEASNNKQDGLVRKPAGSVPEEALSGYLNAQLSNRVVLLQALMKPKQ